ncbi:MAG: hypothetical protein WC637_18870 [Victivallales bacterium]|jgi:tetratricopeptide (TPR) repeat protein
MLINKKISVLGIKLFLCTVTAFSLTSLTTSCAVWNWFMAGISDDEVTELDKGLDVQKRKTPFDDALLKLGPMIQAYGYPSVPIQCKNIGNETAEKGLPSDLYVMISACLNKVGKQITFIPYDVQYVVNESITGGNIERVFPTSVIAGGMTGFDKDLIEKERKGELDAAWAGAQVKGKYDAGTSVARLSLDLNMLDYKTQAYYPQVQASNSINLRRDKYGWAVAAYYMGCGGEFESEVKTQQGLHAALRMLVEFSTIEILGKYFKVPYWKCIKGANPDENLIKYIKDSYIDMTEKQQIAELKRLLFLHGYKNIDRNTDTLNEIELNALSKAKRQYGCTGLSDTLFKLWENLNTAESSNIIAKDRKRMQIEEQNMAAERQKMAKMTAEQEAARKAKEAGEIRELQAKFDRFIITADNYVKENKFDKALEEYTNALGIAPNAVYPREQSEKIRAFFAQQKALHESFKNSLAAGDESFKAKNYDKAKTSYEKAAEIKPDDTYVVKKLEEVNRFLSYKKPSGIGKINEKDFNDE